MTNSKYSIGVDFGTLSARAVLVRIFDGEVICTSAAEYKHGVMDEYLAYSGEKLPPDFALQDPQDYLDVIRTVIPDLLRQSGVLPEDILGLGIDFTCSSVIPVHKNGTPLCFDEKHRSDPHAYVKLWKHHGAKEYADRINQLASPELLAHYGGKISCEFLLPKVWEIYDKAPHIYRDADIFMEAGEWMTMYLTGSYTKSYSLAAAKALYIEGKGYPSEDFYASLDEGLRDLVKDKLAAPIGYQGTSVGNICPSAAKELGLSTSTAVSAPMPDAHAATVALGMSHTGDMCAILGTSACYMLISDKLKFLSGINGVHKNSMTPGFYAYEAGLCSAGDLFAWAVKRITPAEYFAEAEAKGISVEAYLTEKASHKAPEEIGLLALDWWNGNRSILEDPTLSGMILGMTLQTKAEDIFRALLEATAYATRVILENYTNGGIEIKRIVAAGGIALKNSFMMQLYADVLGLEITVTSSPLTSAVASAIYGAGAAGCELGKCMEQMSCVSNTVYRPNAENKAIYDKLYAEYKRLHDYFGKENDIMKKLKTKNL